MTQLAPEKCLLNVFLTYFHPFLIQIRVKSGRLTLTYFFYSYVADLKEMLNFAGK
jgi:hypothetical protein